MDTIKKSSKAEAGNAGEQLARNSLRTDANVGKRGVVKAALLLIFAEVLMP